MTSSRVADLRDATPTGGAKQQVFSSDRNRFVVLDLKTMSSHRSAQPASVITVNKSLSAKLSPAFTRAE
jgi:hypothetical protein